MAYKNVEDEREYQKGHYQRNKELYKERARNNTKIYRERNKDFILEYKRQHPCVFCGFSNPVALDFHHKDSEEKDENISKMMNGCSIKTILLEIEKCVVLCSNCHRILHSKEEDYAPVAQLVEAALSKGV